MCFLDLIHGGGPGGGEGSKKIRLPKKIVNKMDFLFCIDLDQLFFLMIFLGYFSDENGIISFEADEPIHEF